MVVSIIANFETTSYISKNGDSVIEANNSMIDGPIEELDSLKGWVAVGFAFVSMFICFGVVYSFGAFFDPMALEFKASSSETSAVFSITTFMFLTGGVVSGMVADRIGSRPVLIFGGFAMGLGLYLTSLVNSLWIGYITYGVGVGVGVACGYVPMVAVVGAWFEKRRAAALGISVTGVGIGTLVAAPLAAALISHYGWRQTYVIFGVCSVVGLILCGCLTPRPPVLVGQPSGFGKNTCIWVHVFLRFFPIAGAFLSDCISRILCHSSGYR
jgi:MFS family permease